ncbi:MAG: hypothetical protein ACLQNE_01525 [Thermoguttaceae bacterium]
MVRTKRAHVIANKRIATTSRGAKQGASTPAERFRMNLRSLIHGTGLTQKVVCEKIGIEYKRLRKLCGDGLARISPENHEDVRKICSYFGIKRTRLLWSPTLRTADRLPASDSELDAYVEMLVWVWGVNPKLSQLRTALKWINLASEAAVKIAAPDPKDDDDFDMEDLGVRDRNDDDDGYGRGFGKEERAEFALSRRGKRSDDD